MIFVWRGHPLRVGVYMMFRCLLVVWRLLNFAHDLHCTILILGTTLFTCWLDHPSDLLKSASSRVPGWFTTALDPHQRPKKTTRYTMSSWNFFTNLTTEIRIRMESWKNHPTVFNSRKGTVFFWSRENAITCGRFHQSRWSTNLSESKSRLRVQKKLLSKTELQTAFCDVWSARRMPTGKGGHENNRRFLNGFFLTPKQKKRTNGDHTIFLSHKKKAYS